MPQAGSSLNRGRRLHSPQWSPRSWSISYDALSLFQVQCLLITHLFHLHICQDMRKTKNKGEKNTPSHFIYREAAGSWQAGACTVSPTTQAGLHGAAQSSLAPNRATDPLS